MTQCSFVGWGTVLLAGVQDHAVFPITPVDFPLLMDFELDSLKNVCGAV